VTLWAVVLLICLKFLLWRIVLFWLFEGSALPLLISRFIIILRSFENLSPGKPVLKMMLRVGKVGVDETLLLEINL
jgi:hypothetical protein